MNKHDESCVARGEVAFKAIELIYLEAKRQKETEVLGEGSYKHLLEDIRGQCGYYLERLRE